ncbi:hypothetical protein [Bacillus sp. HMF5848]|nr:hypothetical protein [Bacillus sp. HMF5848]
MNKNTKIHGYVTVLNKLRILSNSEKEQIIAHIMKDTDTKT